MAILVTGCAGYIASVASKVLLEEGYEVVGLDNLSTGFKENIPEGLKFYEADICDEAAVSKILTENKIDAVLHFAAFIEVGESVQKPEKYFDNNYRKSVDFLKILEAHNIKSMVYSSTAAVYGMPKSVPIKENFELKPINPYGEAKLQFEEELNKATQRGFQYIAFRYFNVCGAYGDYGECHQPESHLIPLVIDAALKKRDDIKIFGTDYKTHDATAVRDYIHVKDLVDAHLLALKELLAKDSNKLNRAYNLGYSKGFSVREIIDAVKSVTALEFLVVETERRPGDPDELIADSSDAINILGWKPKHNSIETIVKDAFRHRSEVFYKRKANV